MVNKCERVKIVTDKEELVGIVLPSQEKGVVFLKLDSGYNIGIKEEHIKNKEVLEELPLEACDESEHPDKREIKHNPKLPTIAILHTGGTIASKVDYRTGGVTARFSPQELLSLFPELGKICNIDSKLLSNMWSGDMRFAHYSIMAKAIQEEIKKGVKGIILTHGTDTIHYTSAALSFILENLPVPVLIVGAQRSSDRGSSDAGVNVIAASQFITQTDFVGVGICMHNNSSDKTCAILPGTKARKMHSSRRDAFQAINSKPYAIVDYEKNTIKKLKAYPEEPQGEFVVRDKMEEKVALIKTHPNIMPEAYAFYREKKYKGLVIEGTGLGHVSVGIPNPQCALNNKILEEIKKLIHSDCIVAVTTQCVYGRVHPHVYSYGIDLGSAGVIPSEDMHAETAFIKLAWLLGNYSLQEAKELYGKNLRGELLERTEYEEEFAPDF